MKTGLSPISERKSKKKGPVSMNPPPSGLIMATGNPIYQTEIRQSESCVHYNRMLNAFN